ncbi:MAG TPA: DUF2339 domain-containing protein, partial [Bacteroidota bacterium]|nr:DUF2339 domain-containing protein [Bacteroidota bacterium]
TPPTATIPEPAAPSKTREEWEAFVGGKLLNRIGALALILGVGFFLKYAFDNNWISETVRVLIGAAAGLVCLAVAQRTHKRGLEIFSQGLVGSGVAILYIAVYAAFNFYHLVPQWVALLLMSAVTVIAFAQGMYYDSIVVGILGWSGGFLTPFLLSTGEVSETGLFLYISLLVAGILAIVFLKKSWATLEPLTLLSTWYVYASWMIGYYKDEKLLPAVIFASVFWVFFHTADIVRARRGSELRPSLSHFLPALNVMIFYTVLYTTLYTKHHDWIAPLTIVLGALYLGSALFFAMDGNAAASRPRFILTASILLGIATTVQYSGYTTVMFWSVEAVFLLWCGVRWDLRYLWLTGLVFFAVAGIKLFGTQGAIQFDPITGYVPVMNVRTLAYVVVSAALVTGSWLFRDRTDRHSLAVVTWLQGAACAMVFAVLTVEVNDHFTLREVLGDGAGRQSLLFDRLMSLSVAWMAYSIPFAWIGFAACRRAARIAGLLVLLLSVTLATVRGIAFDPIEHLTPLVNVRSIAMVLVIAGMVAHALMMKAYRSTVEWLPEVRNYLGIAIGVTIFSLLTGETRDAFGRMLFDLGFTGNGSDAGDDVVRTLNLQQLSLSGVWLAYSVALMTVGIWRNFRELRLFAIALFGVTILKIFAYDLSFLETLYRIFSFIGLGLILLAVSYAYQRYKHVLFGRLGPPDATTGDAGRS